MNRPPGEKELREGLRDHVAHTATLARARYGPRIDADAILRMLRDRAIVRYPAAIRFDAQPLEHGEFAWPMPLGEHPRDGFALCVHPHFETNPQTWAPLILYHLPSINFGDIVSHAEAELFGSTVLGIDVEEYYAALCALADALPPPPDPDAPRAP